MNYNHIPPDIMTKYLTDDLSAEEKRTAELHIAVCPECAAKLDEQRRFEDAAARSYPRTFSGKLDPDCAKAIDAAIREQLNTPSDSPFWKRRIRGTVLIQFGTVAAVALLLFAMITAPSGGNAAGKKGKEISSDKTKTVLAPDKIPGSGSPAAGKTTAKPQPAAVPAPKTAEVKTTPQAAPEPPRETKPTEPLNPGLVRLLTLNDISLRPPEKETFRQGAVCMDSPYEPGVRILLAVTAPKTTPGEMPRTGLRIHPEGKTVLLTSLAKAGEDDAISAALLCRGTDDPALPFAKVVSGETSSAALAVSAKNVKNKADAPAPLRLAAVMLAAGKPRILLKREIRKKMIEELHSLVKNEYAGSPQVARFLEKLEKVK